MSDIRTNAPGLGGLQQSSNQGAQVGQAKATFKGAELKVIDQQSLIADAAEELVSAFSEEAEKDVSDREVEDGRKAESLERLMQIPELQEIMKNLGDVDKRALFRGLKALIKLQSKDPDQLRKQTKDQFKEPSHQFAALKMLVEALKARGAPQDQIDAAQKAVDDLMSEHGPAITAALNIGATAQGFAKTDLGAVPDLRDAYTTNIHDYKAIGGVIDDLVNRFGEKNLDTSIQFMLKALASDLEAGGSSIDKTKLNLIMSDMKRLKTMTTVLGNCGVLMRNAKVMDAKDDFTPISLLKSIAPLLDAARVQKNQISAIPERAGLTELEHEIRFLNDLKEVVRLIPEESYSQPENRRKLLDAIDDALVEKGDLELEQEEDDDEYEDDDE